MDYSQKYFRPYHKIVRKSDNQDFEYYKGYGKSKYQSPERVESSQKYKQKERRLTSKQRQRQKQKYQFQRQRTKGSQTKGGRQYTRKQNRSQNYSRSPTRNRNTTEAMHKYQMFNARGFSQPIWDHLYQEGLNAMKQRYQQADQVKVKIDVQCTFKPTITKNKRYLIPSNSTFLERNQIWQDNKIQKIVKEKQEIVHKNLADCTFKPVINEKSKSMKKTDDKAKAQKEINSQKQGIKRHSHSQSQGNFRPQLNEIKVDHNHNQNWGNEKNKKFSESQRKPLNKENDQKSKTIEMAKVRNIIRNQLRKIQL